MKARGFKSYHVFLPVVALLSPNSVNRLRYSKPNTLWMPMTTNWVINDARTANQLRPPSRVPGTLKLRFCIMFRLKFFAAWWVEGKKCWIWIPFRESCWFMKLNQLEFHISVVAYLCKYVVYFIKTYLFSKLVCHVTMLCWMGECWGKGGECWGKGVSVEGREGSIEGIEVNVEGRELSASSLYRSVKAYLTDNVVDLPLL